MAFTNHGYLHSAAGKALYNFKVKRAQEAKEKSIFLSKYSRYEIF